RRLPMGEKQGGRSSGQQPSIKSQLKQKRKHSRGLLNPAARKPCAPGAPRLCHKGLANAKRSSKPQPDGRRPGLISFFCLPRPLRPGLGSFAPDGAEQGLKARKL